MKIFIGTDLPELTGKISKRFGHAVYYLLYNTENQEFDVINNPEDDEEHQILVEALDKGAEIFIVGNIGPHAFEILSNGNAKTYLARKMTAGEALDRLNNNELELLTGPTVKQSFHNH